MNMEQNQEIEKLLREVEAKQAAETVAQVNEQLQGAKVGISELISMGVEVKASVMLPASKSMPGALETGLVVIGAGLYDPEGKRWARCMCGNEDINKVAQSGKEYQACSTCRLFLNPDGKTRSMGGGQ
jgi:hypothetical protein